MLSKNITGGIQIWPKQRQKYWQKEWNCRSMYFWKRLPKCYIQNWHCLHCQWGGKRIWYFRKSSSHVSDRASIFSKSKLLFSMCIAIGPAYHRHWHTCKAKNLTWWYQKQAEVANAVGTAMGQKLWKPQKYWYTLIPNTTQYFLEQRGL